MPYFTPFRQENIMNNLLDAYGAAKRIRQANIEEQLLQNYANTNPVIRENYDYDNSLLGSIFGTGIRNVEKNNPNNIVSTNSQDVELPVNQLTVPESSNDITKNEIKKAITPKSSVSKKTVNNKPKNLLGSLTIPDVSGALKLEELKNKALNTTPVSITEKNKNDFSVLGNNAINASNNITNLLSNFLRKK